MIVYVAGPMTGLPDYNYPAFEAAVAQLEAAGFEVVSPTEGGQVDGWAWEDYLRRGLGQLLGCEAVAILDGWHRSRGARVEVHVATRLRMPVRPVEAWLEDAERLLAG